MNRNKFAALFLMCVTAMIGVGIKITAQSKASAGTALVDLTMPALAISPDGKQIALVLRTGDKTQLHLRVAGGNESKPVPGTEGAASPLFSPDGKWIAFFADGKLKKFSVETGQIATLCDAGTGPRGAVWGPDDRIIYTPDTGSALLQVSAAGGTPKPLTER